MAANEQARQSLRDAAMALGLSLSEVQQGQLLAYLALLQKWNGVYNLTAVRDPKDMLAHHLLDSLSVVGPLQRQRPEGGRLLDVGSGAGLPGVVIAICCPQWQVCCVDTVGKKTAFVQQAALSLGLTNLGVRHARVEQITDRFDVVSSRAFASLADFTQWSVGALASDGIWMAMKGKHPVAEIEALAPTVEVFHVEQLQVPGLDAERCLLWMKVRKP